MFRTAHYFVLGNASDSKRANHITPTSHVICCVLPVARETTNDDNITMPFVTLRNYPVAEYQFSFFAALIMPYIFAPIVIVAWMYAFSRAVGEIVAEKEVRMKEGMRIMVRAKYNFEGVHTSVVFLAL